MYILMYEPFYPSVCVTLMLGYQCVELEKVDPFGLIQCWGFIIQEKQQNKRMRKLGFLGRK